MILNVSSKRISIFEMEEHMKIIGHIRITHILILVHPFSITF